MKTRKEYIAGLCSHEEYYAQFVNGNVRLMIQDRLGFALKDYKDLNDIPLSVWDSIGLPSGINDLLKQAGDYWTLAGQVCILKEAARQIVLT